jgi:hypothetical protein
MVSRKAQKSRLFNHPPGSTRYQVSGPSQFNFDFTILKCIDILHIPLIQVNQFHNVIQNWQSRRDCGRIF